MRGERGTRKKDKADYVLLSYLLLGVVSPQFYTLWRWYFPYTLFNHSFAHACCRREWGVRVGAERRTSAWAWPLSFGISKIPNQRRPPSMPSRPIGTKKHKAHVLVPRRVCKITEGYVLMIPAAANVSPFESCHKRCTKIRRTASHVVIKCVAWSLFVMLIHESWWVKWIWRLQLCNRLLVKNPDVWLATKVNQRIAGPSCNPQAHTLAFLAWCQNGDK